MKKSFSNWQDYLQINLVQYAQSKGYTQKIKDKSTKKWLALKNPSTNDKIIITEKGYNGYPYYQNLDKSLNNDRGNIINFELNRLNGTLHINPNPLKKEYKKTFENLKSQSGTLIDLAELEIVKRSENQEKIRKVTSKIKQLQPPTQRIYDYLFNQRGILKETINHSLFKQTILQSPVEMPNGKIITNTAILKTDKIKITGFTIHYRSSKENRQVKIVHEIKDSIYASSIPAKPTTILMAESSIDILSYFQLNQEHIQPSQTLCLSIEGNTSTSKLNITKNYIDTYNIKTLVSLTDLDKNGYLYDFELAKHLHKHNHPSQIIETLQKKDNTLIKIHKNPNTHLFSQKEIQCLTETSLRLNEVNQKKTHVVDLKDFLLIDIPNDIKYYKLYEELSKNIFNYNQIKFTDTKNELKNFNEINPNNKPLKDWNDLLIFKHIEHYKNELIKKYPYAFCEKNNQGYKILSNLNSKINNNLSKKGKVNFHNSEFLAWKTAFDTLKIKKKIKHTL